jgi:pimeloyl-ACP methyl ester carboxylesterase
VILAGREQGDGEPLVLLHGLFGSAGNFGLVQRRLAARFRVIALDLRNHGESPHAAAMDYPAMAADVLETLRARAALPAQLVGHSMGGKVAMAAALAAPDQVAALVVVDIAPVRYEPAFRAYAAAMAGLALRPGLTRAESDRALAPSVAEPDIRGFLLQNLRFGAAPAWRIGLREITDALPVLEDWAQVAGQFAGPTLFMAGASSTYIRPEYREAIRALFPAARLVTVKSAGHWVHADNPDGFLAVLEAFLQ